MVFINNFIVCSKFEVISSDFKKLGDMRRNKHHFISVAMTPYNVIAIYYFAFSFDL